jgi:hypothetical protein
MSSSRIVFQERHLGELRKLVFEVPGVEGAAFVLCGESRSGGINKLISHSVVPIAPEDYLRREPLALSLSSRALSRITKLARYERLSILFAHSHPGGMCEFSMQDDQEEEKLIPFLNARVPDRLHGTAVLTEDSVAARLYVPDRTEVDVILGLGNFLRAIRAPGVPPGILQVLDRQVRAFGASTQRVLRTLRVGIVGLGGTGSPLVEQLYRLGVGQLLLIDPDKLEATNLNRVYGSRLEDVQQYKVNVASTRLRAVGLEPQIVPVPDSIAFEDCARLLSSCDVVFGCTDKQLPRAILTQLALHYCIPVIDTGVLVDSQNGQLKDVLGRVTTLLPGEACLFCRGRISPEGLRIEALSEQDREVQVAAGYAPDLGEPAPAVIAFTSAVASLAVSELLHRITGFMGNERLSTEVLVSFDQTRMRTNRAPPRESCICGSEAIFGRGDDRPFLGMMWPRRERPDDSTASEPEMGTALR